MIDDVLSELAVAITKAHESLKRDLAKLRTGRANSGMLEGIRVDYYGQSTPISQMASVAVPEPRMITVKPWEKNQVQAIERAIRESDLGFNPQTDGDLIRIPIPPLSEERRRDLAKLAKRNGEDCKVAIRKARHDAIDMLSDLKNEGEIGEDDQERAKKKVEEVVSAGVASVDQFVAAREKDIMEV
ncbi:MAG: ribosome recycling factor [Polyangiaceae bacterium]|nr:ribosome recycling factor [Myxococcales bacterium]MCB9583964.1 ribosome recycling factor [Polyangiaceae bacterium]MCB9607780.1 ribosome recycling factor [Polyangiaceae bacterium]